MPGHFDGFTQGTELVVDFLQFIFVVASGHHAATGLEALFGWLYLQGQTERIAALFAAIMEVE